MNRIVILLTIILVFGLVNSMAQKLQRLPLQKKKVELKSPTSWSKRFVKIDTRTKEEINYDPKPRIELLDAKAGKYNLKWIGYDSKEKVIIYQSPDCVDVVVIASVAKSSTGTYKYEYTVQNLATSGGYLNGFAVQTFSSTILPKRPSMVNSVVIGDMSSGIFSKDGSWIRFAPVPPHPTVQPGQTVKFSLYSSSPPGLVMCRVDGGNRIMKGVGEDMPEELEASLDVLGYEAWPNGYTIGPVDWLRKNSRDENISYLLHILPQCQKQGWVTAQSLRLYEQLLRQGNMAGIVARVGNDLKNGSIAAEVFAIVDAMKK